MATASSVLAERILFALRGGNVAIPAGVAGPTWASTSATRVFRGIAGYMGGRNRGRLPFIEYEIESQDFGHLTPEGGNLTQSVRLRVHVGGNDPGIAGELCEAILCAGIAEIRCDSPDNLVALGNEQILAPQLGPWGTSRDAVMQVVQSYGRDDYEVT